MQRTKELKKKPEAAQKKPPEKPSEARPRTYLSKAKINGHSYSKRGEETFERVMRIVATMYRERGYERTSMSALARRAGLTAPAIYHYFGSKQEILASFLDYTLHDLIHTVETGIRGKDATSKLHTFMKALVRWQLQQTPFPEAYDRIFELGQLRNSLPDEQRKHILTLERQFYEIVRGILVEGVDSGEFRDIAVSPTAFAIIAMGDYILGWYQPEGQLTQTQLADCYADLVVAMVKKNEGKSAPRGR
jgi:AcrR family transcriptional regulator